MQNITKQELRQKIKIELSQNKQNFEKWSKLICQNIINSEFYQKAQIVYAYMALPDEVDLSVLIDDALCKNKTVFVPKVVPNSNKMIFFDYSKCQFENGSFGILEPKTEDIKEPEPTNPKNEGKTIIHVDEEMNPIDPHSTTSTPATSPKLTGIIQGPSTNGNLSGLTIDE